MQMYPRDHHSGYVEEQRFSIVYEDSIFEDDYNNGGSTMHMMMKPNHQPLPKHGHNQNHGHVYGGGYNEHMKDRVQHYEANWRRDGWGMKNDQSAHGGNKHYTGEYPHREVMKHGAHQRQFGQHHEDGKRAPVWLSRGNIDD